MRHFVCMFLLTAAIAATCSCAGSPFGPTIQVEVTNGFSVIEANGPPVTLMAQIKHDDRNGGLGWSLTLAGQPCSPSCGTLVPAPKPAMTAVYTPPANPPANETATITVFAVDSKSQTFVFNFSILPAVSVMITNKFQSIIVGAQAVTVNASVMHDPATAGVTWTLTAGGSNCSPACGTLTPMPAPPAASFSASYLPPTTLPAGMNAMPTITATSVTESSESDSFSFTIMPISAAFNGQFAFLLRGFAEPDSPMAIAGAFTADGMGNIKNAELDIDNDTGITPIAGPQSGNYTIDTSFNGVIQGVVNIASFTFPNGLNTLSFRFVLSADLSHGEIVELDGTAFKNAGKILKQDPSALTNLPVGSFAFGFDSDAPVGGRIVEAGQFAVAQGGGVSGIVDQAKAADPTPRYAATPLDATSTATSPDSIGRGTLTLSVQGNASTYAYYVVNASQLLVIQTDHAVTFGTAQAGTARAQNLPFNNATVDTTASVIQLTGMDVFSGTQTIGPDVIIGVLSISNEQFFNLTFDSNDLGQTLTSHPASGTLMSFDPTTGRGQITVPGGFQTGFVNTAVFYLWDAGKGFVIDADPSTSNVPPNQAVTNNAFSGTFTTQAAGPFSSNSLNGNLLASFGGSAIPDIPNLAAGFNVNNVVNTYTAAGSYTSLDSQVGNIPSLVFQGNMSLFDNTLGHGVATFPGGIFGDFTPNQNDSATFYMIGPNQFVLIGRQGGVQSGVAFFDPD